VAATGLPRRVSGSEWSRLGGIAAFIAALHVVGWGTLLVLVVPQQLPLGAKTLGVGVGVTAYTLGMRHAFDADHISAIDNATRKLMSEGRRPLSVGLWFSLGHSTVVFVLAVLLSLGVRAIAGDVQHDGSALHHYTGLIGTSVSGGFLFLIAGINIVILVGILRVFCELRRGAYDEPALEAHLANRGLFNRLFRPLMRAITRPAHMYPVGLLFGLGFDTATEIALLVLAGGAAAGALPWYAILCLPVLFAAGMGLFDTIDGSFMNFAYGWAFANPVRKIFYNLTITALSVAVALIVGTIELLSVLSGQLRWRGSLWHWVNALDLNTLGFAIVVLFVATWVIALGIWHLGHLEDRWTSRLVVPAQHHAEARRGICCCSSCRAAQEVLARSSGPAVQARRAGLPTFGPTRPTNHRQSSVLFKDG
jgi:high-affinity nickel-transport protein